jgi:hypothetical protein
MSEIEKLRIDFDRDVRAIADREAEIGLRSSRFRQMLEQADSVNVAKRLLLNGEPPRNTFTWLRKIGRLDLTVEYYVVMEKYRPLFTDDERQAAKWRLDWGD